MNNMNDDKIERIVDFLCNRATTLEEMRDEAEREGRRIDSGLLLHHREEVKEILKKVIEIVEANSSLKT